MRVNMMCWTYICRFTGHGLALAYAEALGFDGITARVTYDPRCADDLAPYEIEILRGVIH